MAPSPPQVWLIPEPPDPGGFDAAGWLVLPLDPERADPHDPRTLLVGTVDGPERAAAALRAVASGTSVAIHVVLGGAARHRFLEDLSRLGAQPLTESPTPRGPTDAQRALLDLLAEGATVSAAAEALHLSRRTAYRMLDAARALLGVETNAEAISAWARRKR